ncbi:hypothetical protein OF83DRAFT_935068 [Amylostereum chailletii]|nr:hypothetical protein OF83DRAFT_935068 [Amylostereum chailletii]
MSKLNFYKTVPPHGHVLSNRSRENNFDTFMFLPATPFAELAGVINSALNDPQTITVKRVKGWLYLLYPRTFKGPYFEIYPANITHFAHGPCAVAAKKDSEPMGSEKALLPGAYCCAVKEDKRLRTKVRSAGTDLTFTELHTYGMEHHDEYEEEMHFDSLSEIVEREIRERDHNACFLTQIEGDLDFPTKVHWIFPPSCAVEVAMDCESMAVSENTAVTSEGVAKLIHDNSIGIDVDDGFRMVAFDSLPPK